MIITRVFLFLALIICISGCHLEAQIFPATISESQIASPIESSTHGPSLSYGERVVTTAGTPNYEILGAFGELSEQTKSLNNNNWVIEGTFYE